MKWMLRTPRVPGVALVLALMALASAGAPAGGGIGTPDDMRVHLRAIQESGVDQVIFLQQAGKNRHAEICASLELFASDVLPEFAAAAQQREDEKARALAPFLAAAMARKETATTTPCPTYSNSRSTRTRTSIRAAAFQSPLPP